MRWNPTVGRCAFRSGRLVGLVVAVLLASTWSVVGDARPAAAAEPPPSFVAKWGTYGSGNGQFNWPGWVATDTAGNVYVTDSGRHRVQKFSPTGAYITQWGTYGDGDGQFTDAKGIAVDGEGNVYVVDGNRVQKFTSTGGFVRKWGNASAFPAQGDGQFDMPLGIAIDGDGNVYVADSFNHRVQKFTSTGAFITKWGAHGSGNGQFIAPQGIAVDEDGDVYVVDLGNSRVQKFTANGTFISKWGREGTTNGRFSTPNGVAAAPNGDVYITDVNNHRVQRFGYRGRPDGRIRRGTGVLVGNNIYNTTGNRQTRTGSAVRGRSVTYYVSVQNDAVFAERLRLTAGRSTNRFTVRYHSPTGANITRQVTAGTFRTPVLAPQRTYQVRVVVTVLRSAPRNSSLARTLTVRSTTHTTIRDTVKFVTRRA